MSPTGPCPPAGSTMRSRKTPVHERYEADSQQATTKQAACSARPERIDAKCYWGQDPRDFVHSGRRRGIRALANPRINRPA
jgi:hypothetical protein